MAQTSLLCSFPPKIPSLLSLIVVGSYILLYPGFPHYRCFLVSTDKNYLQIQILNIEIIKTLFSTVHNR